MSWKRLLFTILIIEVFSINVIGQSIDRGPYLQSVTTESIYINWRTDSPTDSKIWYGDSPGNLNLTISDGANVTDHELKIDGLSMNSTYYYAVGNNTGQMAGGDNNHYFITTPDTTGTQMVRAWILGDCGTANNNQRDVRDAYYNYIGNEHTDAILLLGDNAYSDGTQSEYQMALFENMYEEKLINSVLWPSFGNHDGHSSLSVTQTGPYYEIFKVPKNGEAGGEPSNTEAYYSFDYGNIHFICINSDDIDAAVDGDMVQWIEADINATNQDWIVAFFHHPPYTGEGGNESDIKTSSTEMRENVNPVLEAGGVDLVLSGHTHAYQRSYLIRGHYNDSPTWDPDSMGIDLGDGRIEGDGAYYKERGGEGIGTVYIVAGSSGKLDNDDYNYPAMSQNVEKLGSVALEVEGLRMDVKFLDSDGTLQDTFTIIKMVDPPVVNITYPADQQYFPTPELITITADASDSNGVVTQVEFFIDNVSVGTDTSEPYSISWEIPADGCYKIKAVATDNDGYFSSSVVTLKVGEIEVCSRVLDSDDDAEEKSDGNMSLSSGDLELVDDGSDQTIGIRFQNLNIPQCAEINSAFVQFTVDDIDNINPCSLTIYAEATDDADAFSSDDEDITNRVRTNASVTWTPADWTNIGDADDDQKTIDISALLQEVTNRPGFTSNSSITIIIDGTGKRVAESFDGEPFAAPELCIKYNPIGPDEDNDGVCDALDQCPGSPEPGMACDDGDPNTENDIITANCECEGEVIFDCPTLMANIGDSCDDGDPNTENDVITSNCECVGESIFDCPNLMANIDDSCDDGNPLTYNDLITSNCECVGTMYDCPSFPANIGDACDDGDPNTQNDIVTVNCECVGEEIFDCPILMANIGDPCDDGDPNTENDEINADCECVGEEVFDCPTLMANIGDSCDDGDSNTQNDEINTDCECIGEEVFDCLTLMANIGDSCDDGDPNTQNDIVTVNCECVGEEIFDCPNLMANIGDSCDDGDPNTENDEINADCECVGEEVFDCPTLMADIGDSCDDGDSNTENDMINSDCECVGEVIFDCPILMANIGDPCDDDNPNTVNDAIDDDCDCIGSSSISVTVSGTSDDAEESEGIVNTNSSDLEMVIDGSMTQIVGLRFTDLGINSGAIIESAYIQFTTDENSNISPCLLEIYGIASDNASTFTSDFQNISSRPKTNASVGWSPEEWSISDESGPNQRSVDISPIVQEIVNRNGFNSNSSIAFVIEGEGKRTAFSYDGAPLKAPQLNILFKNSTVGLEDLSNEKSPLIVYPVPTADLLNVTFNSERRQDLLVQILDLKGKQLLSEIRTITAGENTLLFDNLDLENGMYFIQLQYDGVENSARFIFLK